jgi:hypothetical protein
MHMYLGTMSIVYVVKTLVVKTLVVKTHAHILRYNVYCVYVCIYIDRMSNVYTYIHRECVYVCIYIDRMSNVYTYVYT